MALVACTATPPSQPDKLTLEPVDLASLPGWAEDDQGAALGAMLRSCERLVRRQPDQPIGPSGLGGQGRDWREPCQAAAGLPKDDAAAARRFFERGFQAFRAANNGKPGAFVTGYYEPELAGARAPSPRFTVPLYRVPDDLIQADLGEWREGWRGERIAGRIAEGRLRPYHTRHDIEKGALAGRNLELAWVEDPIDAFFLAIQGSGRIDLGDGKRLRLGFAGQNGHRYVAIGRALVERGAIPRGEVTMQTIRAWLSANPAEAASVMDLNPSYVFYRALAGDGPLGAEGAVLTPSRSLAVDPAFLPLGVPVFIDLEHPDTTGGRLRRLVVAQDTGGAIKGPVRGDLFWGTGAAAGELAGRMQAQGIFYILLPRSIPAS
ncbi:MAG: MltA domain-containing protein [Proteobacteria bacterium]|nr:MltA domain-containing protein [Pseudomonadota bacterium]